MMKKVIAYMNQRLNGDKGRRCSELGDSNELRVLSWRAGKMKVYLLSSALWLPWFGGAVWRLEAKDFIFSGLLGTVGTGIETTRTGYPCLVTILPSSYGFQDFGKTKTFSLEKDYISSVMKLLLRIQRVLRKEFANHLFRKEEQ